MILEVQNSIHQSMRLLDSKLAEILGRQERIVSMLSSGNNNNMQQPPGVTAQYNSGSGSGVVDTIRRDEVNHLMTIQNDLVKNIRDISWALFLLFVVVVFFFNLDLMKTN